MDIPNWELTSSEQALETPWFSLVKNHYRIPSSSNEKEYYLLHERTGVNVIAITTENEIVTIRQYRPGTDSVMIEFPAGYVEDDDTEILARARQELLEETGFGGGTWQYVGHANAMPNRVQKTDHCFLAVGVSKIAEQDFDEDEFIKVSLIPESEVEDLIRRSVITCTTCIAQWHKAMLAHKEN